MELRRVGLSVFGLIVAVSLVLAMATVWLFLTNPVTVASPSTKATSRLSFVTWRR